MESFELDRLFGLALTDARFFRQLREHPYQAVAQFELTEPETQAVVHIAPRINSTQELAVQLDSWMTSQVLRDADVRVEEPVFVGNARLHPVAMPGEGRARSRRKGHPYAHHAQDTEQASTRDGKRGLCLTVNHLVSPS
jgi:hypothetical protein